MAAYLQNRAEAGARASTIKVAAAAIAHNHRDAGFEVPLRHGVARTVLDELTQDDSPGPVRALPMGLDCYLAIRKTAHEPRSGRGGGMERVSNARRRGALDVAMIGLMRDARLRVSEAAELTWGDLQQVPGGSGRVRVGESGFRMVSADTMRLLSSVRRGSDETEQLLGMRPNQIAIRIGAAARQSGLGEGYSGDSPRLGMIRDMETLGVHWQRRPDPQRHVVAHLVLEPGHEARRFGGREFFKPTVQHRLAEQVAEFKHPHHRTVIVT